MNSKKKISGVGVSFRGERSGFLCEPRDICMNSN